ncbi:hypothetical protein CHU00_06730 [Sphingobacterium cellulitidis]|nr:hypothetical protein CHU00_06730 [Sphingobacterium cellulitidis]
MPSKSPRELFNAGYGRIKGFRDLGDVGQDFAGIEWQRVDEVRGHLLGRTGKTCFGEGRAKRVYPLTIGCGRQSFTDRFKTGMGGEGRNRSCAPAVKRSGAGTEPDGWNC